VIQYVSDWQGGLFHISRSEYELMPNIVMQVLRAVQDVKAEIAAKKRAKEARDHGHQP